MLLSSLQPPLLERSLQLLLPQNYDHTVPVALQRVATGVATPTRSAVAPRYTPGIGKIVPRNVNNLNNLNNL